MLSKKKIFIRAMSGASMHFLGLVVWALSTRQIVPRAIPYKAEQEVMELNKFHNWNDFWLPGPLQDEFRNRFLKHRNYSDNTEWLKQHVKFYPTPFDVYVIFVHSINYQEFLDVAPDSVLINIVHDDDDIDQIAWNWAMKTGSREIRLDYEQRLLQFNKNLNKLNHMTYADLPVGDCKFFTYFHKFGIMNRFNEYNSCNRTTNWDRGVCFDIKFKDIMNGRLKQTLPQLCKFLDVNPGEEFLQQTSAMIDNYVSAQIRVPWILTLDEYQ